MLEVSIVLFVWFDSLYLWSWFWL